MLGDNDMMPFGKYAKLHTRMEDVPASYLHWLWTQKTFDRESNVGLYIKENMSFLKADYPDGIWE